MIKQVVRAMMLGVGFFVATLTHAEPSVKSCAYLIDQSFFYHTYETVCQYKRAVGVTMADRFAKQGCEKILSDEQIKAIRDDVLARIKVELKPQSSLSGAEVFCLNHIDEYRSVLSIQ